MAGDVFNSADPESLLIRSTGILAVPSATAGDVLTVQADKTIAADAPVGAPGTATVRGPFAFAFDTASLTTGVTLYAPTVGDVLLDAWIEVDTAFDGTTPLADIGSFGGTNTGLYAWHLGEAFDLSTAGSATGGGAGIFVSPGIAGGAKNSCLSIGAAVDAGSFYPPRFTAATPLLLVVSQTGQKGGTAIGGAAGAGRVYIITATPVAL